MNKKIGLITFHDTANHGAALQLYATLKIISELGYDVEVIDYSNEYRASMYEPNKRLFRELRYMEFLSILKTLAGYRLILRRMSIFNDFYEKHTRRSSAKYSPKNISKVNRKYDVFICGSDQIWNPANNGGDTNYLLGFVEDSSKTISYASSFGAVNIPQNLKANYKNLLSRIKSLSVRESSGADLVREMMGREVSIVVDPVFLLTRSYWEDLIADYIPKLSERVEGPKLLDYTAKKGAFEEFESVYPVEGRFHKVLKFGTNLKIKDILSKRVYTYPSAGPVEFVYGIYSSDFIFTSSFHGTVLAIIFGKQFLVCLSNNEGRDTRIVDILDRLGLQHRIFRPDMSLAEIEEPIDYISVHKKLDELRVSSLTYLKNALITASR